MGVRLQHKQTGKTMFVMNHHGPLPIPSGGKCGGKATAYNMLRKIAENADAQDFIVLTGDFNANGHSHTVWSLERYMHRIFTGSAIGGIDHFFSNCGGAHVVETRNLGNGGSDHDAL